MCCAFRCANVTSVPVAIPTDPRGDAAWDYDTFSDLSVSLVLFSLLLLHLVLMCVVSWFLNVTQDVPAI